MDTIKIDSKNTLMVAHRGVSGLETENTCAAFVAAGNRSYFGIETDVHATADGNYVIIHDDTTGRVGIDNLCVEKSTLQTLQSIVLLDTDGKRGRTDLRIPQLADYVKICKKYGKTGVLELKNAFDPRQIAQIVEIIEKEDYLGNIIFISFDLRNLVTLKATHPECTAQFLVDEYSDDLKTILTENKLDLDIHYKALTKEIIDDLHAADIKINCWTVNEKSDGERLADWGVDFITSNILE